MLRSKNNTEVHRGFEEMSVRLNERIPSVFSFTQIFSVQPPLESGSCLQAAPSVPFERRPSKSSHARFRIVVHAMILVFVSKTTRSDAFLARVW